MPQYTIGDPTPVYSFPDWYINQKNEIAVAERLTAGDVFRLREECDLVEFNRTLAILIIEQDVSDKLAPK